MTINETILKGGKIHAQIPDLGTGADARALQRFRAGRHHPDPHKTEIAEPLTEYAAAYSEAHGYNVQIISAGGSIDYETALKAQFANEAPDIFAITGASMYESFKEFMADQTGADWTQYTSYAYIGDNGEVVGFPVSIEGYGMA